MPMRRSPASRSPALASASAETRATIAPTVRHAMRISCPTAVLPGVHRQPRHHVIEGTGVPSAVPGPRHGEHRRSMLGAGHPQRVGLHERLRRSQIQCPPAARAFTSVIPRALPATPATAPPGPPAMAHMGHHHPRLIVEADLFDDRVVGTQQPRNTLEIGTPFPDLWILVLDKPKP
jgi:hypothetical protein